MPNEKKTISAIEKLQKDLEAQHELLGPPSFGASGHLRNAMETALRQQKEMVRILKISEIASPLKDLIGANHHFQSVFEQTAALRRINESLETVHPSWLDQLKHQQSGLSAFAASGISQLALDDISRQLAATEQLMLGINFEALRARFQITTPTVIGLESSFERVVASYGSLAESVREVSDTTYLPSFILPGATREFFTTANAFNALCAWDEQEEEVEETITQLVVETEQETADCIPLLHRVDPKLARLYIGARDALNSDNPDRSRHCFISLRELLNHLLRRLAPDDHVISWISDTKQEQYFLHNGRPTKRARYSFICRHLSNAPLVAFLEFDTQALMKHIDFLNKVHKLDLELTDRGLKDNFIKTESWLMYILQIHFET